VGSLAAGCELAAGTELEPLYAGVELELAYELAVEAADGAAAGAALCRFGRCRCVP
jgi:hypothetical protein